MGLELAGGWEDISQGWRGEPDKDAGVCPFYRDQTARGPLHVVKRGSSLVPCIRGNLGLVAGPRNRLALATRRDVAGCRGACSNQPGIGSEGSFPITG